MRPPRAGDAMGRHLRLVWQMRSNHHNPDVAVSTRSGYEYSGKIGGMTDDTITLDDGLDRFFVVRLADIEAIEVSRR